METQVLLLVLAIAVAAPLLAEIPLGFRMPVAVLEMFLGIVAGPHVLGLVAINPVVDWLGGTLGLSALFFMAGMELDFARIKGRPLSLAARGWALSLALGLVAASILHLLPFVHTPMMVAIALATTALGVLVPILRDSGNLDTEFGRMVLAAGAIGEFGPIVVMSLFLTSQFSSMAEAGLMLVFVAVAFGAARIALGARPPRVLALLTRTMESSSQLPVRISMLLMAALVVLSYEFGFEIVPGAFAAGMVVGLATRGDNGRILRTKIEAICFGFLVPFFYVGSGISFDLGALLGSVESMLLVPVFLALLLAVRGAPVFLYRQDLAKGDRLPFALYVATALPIVIAITEIGTRTGRMDVEIATGLVGASMLSVFLFPALAGKLRPVHAKPGTKRSGTDE